MFCEQSHRTLSVSHTCLSIQYCLVHLATVCWRKECSVCALSRNNNKLWKYKFAEMAATFVGSAPVGRFTSLYEVCAPHLVCRVVSKSSNASGQTRIFGGRAEMAVSGFFSIYYYRISGNVAESVMLHVHCSGLLAGCAPPIWSTNLPIWSTN